MVAAYAGESGLVLGQKGVRGDGKESELGLATSLLAQLELEGRVVAGDALYAHWELSLRVLEQGGDYFWALKDNQPGVKEAVSLLFEQPPWGESFAYACQEGRHGDRWERRRLWASTALNDYLDWPGLGQVCCLERTRWRKGRETVERAYAITSLTPERADAALLLVIWREHWGIENRLHWVRDVVFGEDQSQVNRVGAATVGGPAEPGDRHVEAERGENHSGGLAPLWLETLGDSKPHRSPHQQLKDPAGATDSAHCQVVPVTPPSGSARMAVTAAPTLGRISDRVTIPFSSTLVTATVTLMVSAAPAGSVAPCLCRCRPVSRSPAALWSSSGR